MANLNKEDGTICLNLTAEESVEYIYTDIEFILILICIPVICISGLLLNSAYLFVLFRVRDMRTTTNFYLGNLAVADSFILLIRLIRYVGTYIYSPADVLDITPFNNAIICGLPLLLINCFEYVSVFFISLVAFERYNSICKPLTHRRVSGKLRTLRPTLLAWILPFVFVSYHTGSFDLQKICLILPAEPSTIHIKVCPWKRWVAISINIFAKCIFWTAFVGNCTMYTAIVCKLSIQKRKTVSNKSARERNHVAKMLIINACVFFICLIPMQISVFCKLVDMFSNSNLSHYLPSSFLWFATVTSIMNSAINPLIYGVTNPNYRKAFQRAFLSSCLTAPTDTFAIDMKRKDIEA